MPDKKVSCCEGMSDEELEEELQWQVEREVRAYGARRAAAVCTLSIVIWWAGLGLIAFSFLGWDAGDEVFALPFQEWYMLACVAGTVSIWFSWMMESRARSKSRRIIKEQLRREKGSDEDEAASAAVPKY